MLVFPLVFAPDVPQISVKEAVMLKLDGKKIDLSSLVVSPDRARVACVTADRKTVLVDGKKYGPFLAAASPTFSGDSRSMAFIAVRRAELGGEVYINGEYVKTESEVTKVLRLGETGPIAWTEQTKAGVRLCTPEFKTAPMPKVIRSTFSPDGKGFAFIFSEVQKDPAKPTNDFLMMGNTPVVPRGRTSFCYPAQGGNGYLSIHLDTKIDFAAGTATSFGDWNGQKFAFEGTMVGSPIFNSTGDTWALRSEFTGATPKGNMQFSRYTTTTGPVRELEIQSGFAFRPGSSDFVLCGKRGDELFLKRSPAVAVPYSQVPGLEVAPREMYKSAAWFGKKIALLFQSKRTKPSLFVEGKGMVDLAADEAMPNSLSVSPDGKYLALNVVRNELATVMIVPLEDPLQMAVVGKEDSVVDQPAKVAPLWVDNRTVRFMALRKGQLIRMDATIQN